VRFSYPAALPVIFAVISNQSVAAALAKATKMYDSQDSPAVQECDQTDLLS
jgi:hypothetical protein